MEEKRSGESKSKPAGHIRRLGLLGLASWLSVTAVWMVVAGEGLDFSLGTGTQPEIVTDNVGNVVIVWDVEGGIQGQSFDPFGDPSGDFSIGSGPLTAGQDLENPDVTFLPAGEFVVTWEQQTPSGSEIVSQQFSSGSIAFGAQLQVTPSGQLPVVGADDSGRLVVAWKDYAGAHGDRFNVQRFLNGSIAFGAEFSVGQNVNGKAALAVKPNGDFMIAWENASHNIRGRVYDSTGAPKGRAFRLNVSRNGDHNSPAIAVTQDGHYAVVWEKVFPGSGKRHVFARKVLSYGVPDRRERRVNRVPAFEATGPSVAADQYGNTLVTWRMPKAPDTDEIVVRQLNSRSIAFGAELRISTMGRATNPEVSTGGMTSDFIVVWQSESQAGAAVEPEIHAQYLQLPLE